MATKKLVFLAATLAAMVVLTQATITITTEVDTEYDMEQCSRQLRGQWPNQCEQYMKQQGMMSRRGGQFDDIDRQGSGGRQFEKCCDELEMMQPHCQCEAMRMMKEMMGMSGPQMAEKIMELPMRCGTMKHRCSMSGRM